MRTRNIFLASLMSLASLSPALAAELSPNTIVVSGSAEVLASPDTAKIDIGVVNTGPLTSAALHANNLEMAHVVAAIRALGISDSAIQTSNFAIEAQHPESKNGVTDETRTTGYQVTNKLTVTVSDLTKVADIIDAAVKAGANSSNSVSFGLINRQAMEDKLLGDAVRDARHRAELLAAAEHAKVGRMISIDNASEGGAVAMLGNNPAMEAPTPILAGQVLIFEQVTVVFAVE